MQAINAIDKTDIMEVCAIVYKDNYDTLFNNILDSLTFQVRSIKNPPEILQQVLEAVCILLGVKADWSTAKVILADPYLQQKLLDIDKDNIPDQVIKKP